MGNVVSDIFGGGGSNNASTGMNAANSAYGNAGSIYGTEAGAFQQNFGPLMQSLLGASGYDSTTGKWDSSGLTNTIANQNTEGQVPQYENAINSTNHDAVSSGFAGGNSWTPTADANIRTAQASDAQKNYETAGQDAYQRLAGAFGTVAGLGQSAASGYNEQGNGYLNASNSSATQSQNQQNGLVNGITGLASLFF